MNSGTKIIGIIIAAGVIIGASIWLGRQNQTKPLDPGLPDIVTPQPDSPMPSNPVVSARPTNNLLVGASSPSPTQSIVAPVSPTPAPGANLITDWNEKIDEALKSGGEDPEVAKSLLKLFPRFPPEGQEEAVQHISNLLPDEEYAELGKLMEDATLPEDVLDQLSMDLLNRPNNIMLPELVKVARNPQHPKAGEAKDFLELYLEEDYGADWNLWQAKVAEWLKENPE
jgi:hypothetical protein